MSAHADEAETRKGQALIEVLSCVLSRLVLANDQKLAGRRRTMTKFHALRPPDITVRAYLQRILKFAACSPECFVLALVYIDRLIRGNRFVLSSLNVHRVIITSVMLAAKFFDDQYFKNKYYAQVGGVPCAEINSLELEFLFSINFSLHVKPEDFAKYELELRKHVTSSVGCRCHLIAPDVDSVFTMSKPIVAAPTPAAVPSAGAGAGAGHGTAHAGAARPAPPPPVPAPPTATATAHYATGATAAPATATATAPNTGSTASTASAAAVPYGATSRSSSSAHPPPQDNDMDSSDMEDAAMDHENEAAAAMPPHPPASVPPTTYHPFA